MTTSESLFALKLILEANWMYANYANMPTPGLAAQPTMNDDQLQKADELFRAIVGEAVAQRLADWFMESHASADDGYAITQDAGELMKLAAIVGLTQ